MNRATWLQDRRMQKFRDVLSRWEAGELGIEAQSIHYRLKPVYRRQCELLHTDSMVPPLHSACPTVAPMESRLIGRGADNPNGALVAAHLIASLRTNGGAHETIHYIKRLDLLRYVYIPCKCSTRSV
jgi:hypothetical protein